MFMSCLTISSEGKPVRRICKSAMLGKENQIIPYRFTLLTTVLRIHDILVLIRIRGSMALTNPDSDPEPAIFIIDLQDANKN
jgi:hypothetical protein